MYGSGEVGVFLEMLFESYLGWGRVRLLTSREQTIDQSDLLRFHWALEDLKLWRPIQHIIGHVDFCGCRIGVSPDVLVPRPETEEMVKWIVDSGQWTEGGILDLCTGSGCIAIALKNYFPAAEVTGVDVSVAALEMACENAKNNGVEVCFRQADVLAMPSTESVDTVRYELIVSNPPYVRVSERVHMRRNVLDYDPALALFVPDDDALRFYKAIAGIAKEHLAEDGMLVVEINEVLADETCEVIKDAGFTPEVHSDFRGKARWIRARHQS